jgi:hypothetical protein
MRFTLSKNTMEQESDNEYSLDANRYDYVASTAKAVLGAVPFAGSLLVELAGHVIPDQRLDRITKFARALEDRLAGLEQDFVRSQFTNENFTDLLEEGLHQAARSITDERRAYIATLIVESLSDNEVEYAESKHLLRILGELNDTEVIWLRFFAVPFIHGDTDFRSQHDNVLQRPPAFIGSSQETHDKLALQGSYKAHLAELNLISPRYQTDIRTKQPEFDTFTGGLKLSGYQITGLGRLLLRHIGIYPDENSGDEHVEGGKASPATS